ncbi:glycoside hydrolase family 125 protein [Allofournierella sp.]|uniref:glycoside hydrolase family 125 protein n=1 Tax=Allofournierella sp. TaxID=1940256 RepID=UPI003AB234E0
MTERYLPTGNEMVSLPRIDQATAGIEDFTFLHMNYKGLVDVRGGGLPLILPFVETEGGQAPLCGLRWQRLGHWVPQFHARAGAAALTGTYLAPVEERGFALRLEIHNPTAAPLSLTLGVKGEWAESWHCVNEDKPIDGVKHCFQSPWNGGLVFDLRCGVPMFCFAPMADRPCRSTHTAENGAVQYEIGCDLTLAPGQEAALTLYWGLGFEEVAAATSAKEMLRQGYEAELARTLAWLGARTLDLGDEALTRLYNLNLFFCIFYSTGVTLDTEELVLVTSRSPRYYVSAAYWDRDSLFWSFPAILDADPPLARRMLEYVFGRQRRNLGVHSRFIDGTVLEPGFELDELMAPVLALERYVGATGDTAFAAEPQVQKGLGEVLQKLATKKASQADLYETFLQPTDDERVHPYLTYDNVLVWRGLRALAKLLPGRQDLACQAGQVRAAIGAHCVKTDAAGRPYYAWSVDLSGGHDVYDEPPGSLQLLPYLGFCSPQDEVYQNTVAMIRSPEYKYSFAASPIAEIGCPHAPHPWILSVANSLLCGRVGHSLAILRKASMDNGIVCESIHEVTGEAATGQAFATCAGFLCHSLRTALKGAAPHA